jgi:two-component system, NarL family, response regulator DevR
LLGVEFHRGKRLPEVNRWLDRGVVGGGGITSWSTPGTLCPMRVLLVDDHEVVRKGVKALIESSGEIQVVGEAATVAEAVRRVGFDDPEVVVLDVRLPDGSGVEACREIRARFPAVRVLMLTSFADEEALLASIVAGASGYVLKRIQGSELVANILKVGRGESLLDPTMTEKLFRKLRGEERAILGHIADGLTNRQIAEEMFLAEKTVKNYVSNLLAKLGMQNRSQAAAYMARLDERAHEEYPPEEWEGGSPV